jgi:hypothetical protein
MDDKRERDGREWGKKEEIKGRGMGGEGRWM